MPRRPLDQYETPPHYVAPLLETIGDLTGLSVFEPCVGKWHIASHLMGCRELITNDIDHRCAARTHLDARTPEAWACAPVDWVITNPPFSDELAILEHALAHSHNVAMLARLSFLEPTLTRAAFWAAHPPTDVIVLPRYSFRKNDAGKRQTDSVTCCWLLFEQNKQPCMTFSQLREAA